MINHHGHWLPTVTIGLPVIALAVIVLALVTAAFVVVHIGDGWQIGWMVPAALLGCLIFFGFGYYPWHGDYHRLQPVTGTVAAVDSRFLAASQYVVVTYAGGQVVRCDDSRCATVRPGEQLRLLCTKAHQFGSPIAADGWACRWGERA